MSRVKWQLKVVVLDYVGEEGTINISALTLQSYLD